VTLGDSIGSPAATFSIASMTAGGDVSLRRNPAAPCVRARTTYWSASKVVSTMTFGGSARTESR
jgi:hypothetical protein